MAQYLTRQSDELAAHDSIYKHLNKSQHEIDKYNYQATSFFLVLLE